MVLELPKSTFVSKKEFIKNFIITLVISWSNLFFHPGACFAGDKDSAQTDYKKMSLNSGLTFIPNKGQFIDMDRHLRPDILYKMKSPGADIYLRKAGVSYVFTKLSGEEQNCTIYRIDMDFIGCNDHIETVNEDESKSYTNYYLAQCPKGIVNVKEYNKVMYKNIYNNIDVAYYGTGSQTFKYDIVVNPNGNVNDVKLHWSGLDAMEIDKNGKLIVKKGEHEFYESLPKVYQILEGKEVPVNARYILKRNDKNIVTFKIGNYNKNYPLIIDPLTWITYFGGNEEDFGASLAVDHQHNVIFQGYTESPNLPVSPGAFHTTLEGFSDGFVAKFTPGGARIWATYLGGSAKDEARGGVAIDDSNRIYITSVTWSTDFPLQPWGAAYMQVANGATNNGTAYIALFTPAGTLTWSSYYGGSVGDWGTGIAIDGQGNIIMGGTTNSANFPVLNAYQPNLKGSADAYIVKFNNQGVRQWATYYGGTGAEQNWALTTDASNNIYICGKTSSANFPTVAAYQSVYGGGADDGYLVQLNTANGFPNWSTYYGGNGDDWGTALTTDKAGDVFLGLYTNSNANISTPGAYQAVFPGGAYDGGIVKFTSSGMRVWATYFGGNKTDEVSGLAIDENNNISVGSNISSNNFPVTACSFQSIMIGNGNSMGLAKFSQNCQLLCSTFVNNSSTGPLTAGSIAVDGVWAYLNGTTEGNLPVTPGAFQSVYGGTGALGDAAFVKLCSYSCDTAGGQKVTATFKNTPLTPCQGQSVTFNLTNSSCDTASTTYSWSFMGGTPATLSGQNPTGISWNTPGTYPVKVNIVSPCDSTIITNNITIPPSVTATALTTNAVCGQKNGSASISPNGGTSPYTYSWSGSSNTNSSIDTLSPGTYTCTVTDQNGCTGSISVTILPVGKLHLKISPTISITAGTSTQLFVSTGTNYQYLWKPDTGLSCTTCPNPVASPTVTKQYCVFVDSVGCKDTACVTIDVGPGLLCGDVFVPDAFTPNTAHNNILYVRGNCIKILDFNIFDRWGNKVFESDNPAIGWDGHYRGDAMDMGTYVWYMKATLKDGSTIEKKGNVALIR